MQVDGVISDDLLAKIEKDGDMIWAVIVRLNGEQEK
jgi:hypothetical protein